MLSPFKYSYNNKRYHTADYYFKNKYGKKIIKVTLDGGFTCPNRDGKVGTGGCCFCPADGSSALITPSKENLEKQFNTVKDLLSIKWKDANYIAYFQAYSNTYGDIEKLKHCFEPFINKENVVGLSIATRPDCFNEEIYTYLEDVNKRCDLYIELGLQTINDETGKNFNRGYNFNTFKETIEELNKRNIKVIVHIINGLPNETKEMMIQTVKELTKYKLHGIKFHMLGIMEGTVYGNKYKEKKFNLLTKNEYLDIVKEQLELLHEDTVVYRICSDPDYKTLIAPLWLTTKKQIANDLDKLLLRENTYQAKRHID